MARTVEELDEMLSNDDLAEMLIDMAETDCFYISEVIVWADDEGEVMLSEVLRAKAELRKRV